MVEVWRSVGVGLSWGECCRGRGAGEEGHERVERGGGSGGRGTAVEGEVLLVRVVGRREGEGGVRRVEKVEIGVVVVGRGGDGRGEDGGNNGRLRSGGSFVLI